MFKPSKNFTRGFDQWSFLRGQELDPYRSGPEPTKDEIDHWLAREIQGDSGKGVEFVRRCLRNMHGRTREEDYFNAQIMMKASHWLEENQDAEQFFLVVECFDPHEPWFVPEHYRRLYDDSEGQEHVISTYNEIDWLHPELLHRAQMNYSGLVTMCDHWFGHFLGKLKNLGLSENTIIFVLSDHGHSIGDGNYMGKRGYPSRPEVFEVILMVSHPEQMGAGQRSDLFLQHTDISAQILAFAGITPQQELHGKEFWQLATSPNGQTIRDHVTVAWGDAITVIDGEWWLNCKIDKSGPILYNLNELIPFQTNVAEAYPEVVDNLYALGTTDAGGEFPDYLLKQARGETKAPVWDPLSPTNILDI
jgi:arylsulfatase A-like enzyme